MTSALRKWMRKENVYDPDTEAQLIEIGIEDPETDFANVTQSQWDDLWRVCVVQRAKDLKDQKAKVRLEKRMKKLEKVWRTQSGIQSTSIKKSKKKKKGKGNTNRKQSSTSASTQEQSDALASASGLKKFLQKNQCYAADLLMVCAQHEVFTEDDLEKIDSNAAFDEIYREVRVLRAQELKDQTSKLRMEKLMTKFEKLWRAKTGYKKTSVKKTKGKKKKKKSPTEERNDELSSGSGGELKKWMRKNSVWEKQLFDELLSQNITDESGLVELSESEFDQIVRKVRVEKFKELKDQTARNRVDKLLVSFEKIWRKQSGLKKTSIK